MNLPSAMFMGVWAVAALCWFYGVAEFIGIRRLRPWAYRRGWVIVERSLPLDLARPQGGTIELREVKARTGPAGEIHFLAPAPILSLRIRTPFPIKGTIEWSAPAPRIIGRLPVGTVAFLVAWLAAWTLGAWMGPGTGVSALGFVLAGWGFAAALIAVSLPVELKRFARAQASLIEHLERAERG